MPSTANQVARWLKLPRPLPSAKLLDPHTNLQLGAHYLAHLLKKWNGSLPLALASYNAGSGAVQRWLAKFQGNSLDEFVEEIPIDETRNYVKRVLKSWATYRLIYGLALPTNLGPFPSKAASLD
jgi:soluble lytic murein transglycosylase